MDSQNIQDIIKGGENERVEFKSNFNDSVIETISAFSNNKGGRVFIGLNNEGEPVKGFSFGTETIQKWLNEIEIKTQPSIIPDIDADLKTGYYQANARNKVIAEAFYLTGDIEKYGSGFIRIGQALKEYPTMKLDFREIPIGFYVELSYTIQKTASDNVTDNVTDIRGIKILQSIKENNQISTIELSEKLKVTKRTILRDIEKLKTQNKLKRVGGEKTGFWEIIEKKI